jgi:general secretion pathway protein G
MVARARTVCNKCVPRGSKAKTRPAQKQGTNMRQDFASSERRSSARATRGKRALRAAGRRAGFTLVEMLVVLAIIGSIVGLVGPRVLNYLSESKVKTAQIQMENLASALDLFYLDAGRYPSSEEGLNALVQRPPGVTSWSGPYLKSTGLPKDPWGHPYLYRSPGQNGPYDVGSLGPEGREGGNGALSRGAPAK